MINYVPFQWYFRQF